MACVSLLRDDDEVEDENGEGNDDLKKIKTESSSSQTKTSGASDVVECSSKTFSGSTYNSKTNSHHNQHQHYYHPTTHCDQQHHGHRLEDSF